MIKELLNKLLGTVEEKTRDDLIQELIKDGYNNFYRYGHWYNNYKIIKELNLDYKKITYITRNITRKLNIAKKMEKEDYIKKTTEILEDLENEIRKSTIY